MNAAFTETMAQQSQELDPATAMPMDAGFRFPTERDIGKCFLLRASTGPLVRACIKKFSPSGKAVLIDCLCVNCRPQGWHFLRHVEIVEDMPYEE